MAGLKFSQEKVVSVQDWDKLVREVYGKPYSFQQQDGCKSRGIFRLAVPDGANDFLSDSIPEEINGFEMGVSFESWKRRDPKAPVGERSEQWEIDLFWHRNFYPSVQMIANDLHRQGKIETGHYIIDIDW